MSHFSVCVVIPADSVGEISESAIERELDSILSPYYEGTEEIEFLEFEDRTEKATEEYKTDTMRAVRYPDGKIVSAYDRKFSERFTVEDDQILEKFDKEHGGNRETEASRELAFIPAYPVSAMYSFEEYCEDYCGYSKRHDGHWGYYCNPNAQWDWFEIGGRFSGELLVREGTEDALSLSASEDLKTAHPEGFRHVNGAFMRDIAWEKMREIKLETVKFNYERFSEAFRTKDISKLGPLTAITDEGISCWGTMLYLKDETLEEYMIRRGATEADLHPIHTYAFVNTEGEWIASGDIGWFGLSSNDKPERVWLDEIKAFTEEIAEDDFVVIVDCHI